MAPALAPDRIGASSAELVADEDDETPAGSAAAQTPRALRVPGRIRFAGGGFGRKDDR
jgi:hypothetical protein